MDNHRLFSLVCGRQPVFSGYIDPDCRRGDCPPDSDKNLPAAGLAYWSDLDRARDTVDRLSVLLHVSNPHLNPRFTFHQFH